MTKHLYLLRHAQAAEKESRQDDKSRELTSAGIRDALHMGAWLREQQISFDLIATSSAVRAVQTAELVIEGMKVEPPRTVEEDTLYDASVRQLLDYVNNLEDAYSSVLLVGHNPPVSYLAEYLTKAEIGSMGPGSVVMIRFGEVSWKVVSENSGEMVKYVGPEVIRGEA